MYGKAKDMLSKKPEDIEESDLESLYEDFLQIDASYESKKYRGFVNNQLRRRREDLFRFVINRSVESTNNRGERAIRSIVTYKKVVGGFKVTERCRLFYKSIQCTRILQKERET